MATATFSSPELNLAFPQEFEYLFRPARYKVAHGGRGSAKSWSYARALIQRAVERPERILCCRELQNSISESVHRLLSDQIEEMGYGALFEVQQNSIYRRPYDTETGKLRGSEFFFYGIKSNTNKIKSAEGITIVWCEEAEKISEGSWEILIPTIRTPGSEIWVSFNPDEENDPTYQRFVVRPPPDALVHEVNWHQNPYFPEVLRTEMEYLRSVDVEAYEHVWNGQCRRNASSQIFRGKYIIEEFTPPNPADAGKDMWDGPYFGGDWGFANDPVAISKLWIDYQHKPKQRLYVEYAEGSTGIELDDIPTLFKRIPGVDGRVIRADCSRPETINHVGSKAYCENLVCDFTFNSKAPEPKCPKCGVTKLIASPRTCWRKWWTNTTTGGMLTATACSQ